MIRTLILVLVATFAFAVDEKPEPKSPATILYEKALADNSKDAEKAYGVYLKALEAANAKIVKALEVAKADLNDPKKGKLSITERAKALEELDGKMKAIKEGAMATVIAEKAKNSDDLLGDKPGVVSKSPIVGNWILVDKSGKEQVGDEFIFKEDGTGDYMGHPMKWTRKDKEKDTFSITFETAFPPPCNFRVSKVKKDGDRLGADMAFAGHFIYKETK
jgi:hypothetical protein